MTYDVYKWPQEVIDKLNNHEPEDFEPCDVDKESIARWAAMQTDDAWVYVAAGFGDAGECVRPLLGVINKAAKLVVLESSASRIAAATSHLGADIINSGRVILIDENDKSIVHTRLAPIADYLCRKVAAVSFLYDYDVEWWQSVLGKVAEFTDSHRINLNTITMNSRKTYQNVLYNIYDYVQSPAVTGFLKDVLVGKVAVVVAAGPSIDKQLGWLAHPKYRGRYCLISVPTMLAPLLEHGVCPDILCSLDYHELSGKFFENIDKEKLHENIVLVAQANVNPAVVRAWKKLSRPLYFTCNEWATRFLDPSQEVHNIFIGGATVAHLCYLLADLLGCDPIIAVGLDLAFTDNRYYPRCVTDVFDWKKASQERLDPSKYPYSLTPDIDGAMVRTDEQMRTYCEEFDVMFSHRARQQKLVIDCTEGGAKKDNVERLRFHEALEKYCTGEIFDGRILGKELLTIPGIMPDAQYRTRECISSLLERRLTEFKSFQAQNAVINEIHRQTPVDKWTDEDSERTRSAIEEAQREMLKYMGLIDLVKMWSGKIGWWQIRHAASLEKEGLSEKAAEIFGENKDRVRTLQLDRNSRIAAEVDSVCSEIIKVLEELI